MANVGKRFIKQNAQKLLANNKQPIIVASMGRSGSTLVFKSIRKAIAKSRFDFLGNAGIRLSGDEAWDLSDTNFIPGVVYKTHGLAKELPANTNAKVIFLFGNASEAAMSVIACKKNYGAEWIKEHFTHLRANGEFDELPYRDVLRFEEQLCGWIGLEGVERLIINYDSLWECNELLSKFTGYKIELPERKARVGAMSVTGKLAEDIKQTYSKLDSEIQSLSHCKILK